MQECNNMIYENEDVSESKSFHHDLLENNDRNDLASKRRALGQAAWLETFWLPTQQRKNPNHPVQIKGTVVSVDHNNTKAETPVDWNKLLQTALKKVQVEDLGELAATDLWSTIPIEDSEGRGRADLETLEKQLSVKVVFLLDDNHILLVGAKAKLQKKCLVIRNVLSHYYWRLKGRLINL